MFKRRTPRKLLEHLRETFWPTQGWTRTFHYFRHRIFRGGDTAHQITAGLAIGASVSFSPLLGTHFFQSFLLCKLLRANWIAAFVGTAWGNPWTFPFLFWASYTLGVSVTGLFGAGDFMAMPAGMNMDYFLARPWEFLVYLFAHPWKLLVPMTLGGVIAGALFWPLAYAILYYPVTVARKTYRKQRLRRMKKRREKQQQQTEQNA